MSAEQLLNALIASFGTLPDEKPSPKYTLRKPNQLHVLHVAGSPVSQYYFMVSVQYARQMLASASDEATQAAFDFTFGVVLPGGAWCIVRDLDQTTIDRAPRLEIGAALSAITASDFDVCVPHMFCYPGYTQYRSIFDLLNIPLVGNTAECMAICTDKQQTKAVVAAAGVPVPPGELLHSADQTPTIAYPFVLKPCCEDNSMGVSKVEDASALQAALAEAFKFDTKVVCEKFIPLGREIRVAVVEDETGEPTIVLPATEYLLTPEHPMRLPTDKVAVTRDGLPKANPKEFLACQQDANDKPDFRRTVCPAPLDTELAAKLGEAAKRAHKALQCRDFSLYDFRVDPKGEVYMLECQPVCSFARESVIISMVAKSDRAELQHPRLFHSMLRRAAARKSKPYEASQKLGMKAASARSTNTATRPRA